MRILDALVPKRSAVTNAEQRYSFDQWIADYFQFGGNRYPLGFQTTYGTQKTEPIGADFAGYVNGALKSNGIISAVELVRVSIFAEARFQFQELRGGRPGDLVDGESLALLHNPWPGGVTGDLLGRMILDADMAGNFYAARVNGELVRLRPDWTEIILGERVVPYGPDSEDVTVGLQRVGYLYFEGGRGSKHAPAMFLADEVCHFAPYPDPLATYRGMSWLTPVIRELQADQAATQHKLKFFENAATPNLAVSLPKEITTKQFNEFVSAMDDKHQGAANAYKTLYTAGGADVTVVGADMRQLDFKTTQGAGETRIAAAAGVHPVIVGLSEGLQGSSLNAGNFGAARRRLADGTMRPLWRNAAGSLQVLVKPPPGHRLWYDDRDIPFLSEDARDAAEIMSRKMLTIESGIRGGFVPESIVDAVASGDLRRLKHTGLFSVQLQPAGSDDPEPPDDLLPDDDTTDAA
jgi:phage portal protein BeeE